MGFLKKLDKLLSEDVEETEATEAEEMVEMPDLGEDWGFGETNDWTGIPNPVPGKTLEDLKGVKKPLDSGWSFGEVVAALKPFLIHMARRYSTDTFSPEESIASGIEGVWRAILKDKGIAPFTSHVYRWVTTYMSRGAAGASNVSGIKPSAGGKLDWLKGSKATVSADTPADEGEGSMVSSFSGDAGQGEAKAKQSGEVKQLLYALINNEEVGLNDKEKAVVMAKHGLGEKGTILTNAALSEKLGISAVRVSQILKSALNKIKGYMEQRGYESPEDAMIGMDIGESVLAAAYACIVLEEAQKLEDKLYGDLVEIDYILDEYNVLAKVNTKDFIIEHILYGDEDFLSKATHIDLANIREAAKSKLSPAYYNAAMESVIGFHGQHILGIIGTHGNAEDDDNADQDDEKEKN